MPAPVINCGKPRQDHATTDALNGAYRSPWKARNKEGDQGYRGQHSHFGIVAASALAKQKRAAGNPHKPGQTRDPQPKKD
jgi:hypothetical protein